MKTPLKQGDILTVACNVTLEVVEVREKTPLFRIVGSDGEDFQVWHKGDFVDAKYNPHTLELCYES